MFQYVRGIVFITLMLFVSVCGFGFYMPVFKLLWFCRSGLLRTVAEFLISSSFALMVTLYETIFSVSIIVHGDVDKLHRDNSTLIVMNHRSRLDWFFYFSVQTRYASLRNFKIALKDDLKRIPVIGWATQIMNFVFLKRRFEQDKFTLSNVLDLFSSRNISPQLLIFPEGTDLRAESKGRSDQYAESAGLPLYDHVLHPRTTGFTYIVDYMKTRNDLNQVLDVTVAYPSKDDHPTEISLFTGKIPKHIYFHISSFDLDTIKKENGPDLATWLKKRWEEKEHYLKSLYMNRRMDYTLNNNNGINHMTHTVTNTPYFCAVSVLFWSVSSVLFVTLLINYTLLSVSYLFVAISWYILMDLFYGIDRWTNRI